MKHYRVTQRMVTEDSKVYEANSAQEAIDKFNNDLYLESQTVKHFNPTVRITTEPISENQ
jgi:hypothetical protein